MDAMQETIRSYDKTVAEYTANVAVMQHTSELVRFKRVVPRGSKVLDLGCASGRDVRTLVASGYSTIGVDLSKGMLDYARQNIPYARFLQMDMRQLAFSDECFDGVWSVSSMLHLQKQDMQGALDEAYRVLKSTGIFYIAVKQGNGEGLEEDKRYGEGINKYYSYYQVPELEEMLAMSGFRKLERKVVTWDNEYQKKPEIRILSLKF